VYTYLVDRCLVLTDGAHVIAARDGFIYYSDAEFTQRNSALFKAYL